MSTIVRFDKNLAHNANDFKQYQDDANLIKSLIVYIAHTYSSDLFGYGRIDPYHFAKIMGYKSTADLMEKVESPAQFRDLTDAEIRALHSSGTPTFESKFENALFKMSTEALRFTYQGKTFKGQDVFGLKTMLLLDDVKIITGGPRGKKAYEISPSKYFVDNLSRYFTKINIDAFNKLRRSNSQTLYLYLVNLKDNLKINKSVPNLMLDFLCKLGDIGSTRPSDKKKKLIKKLEKINEADPNLQLELSWGRNGRFNFRPLISFEYEFVSDYEKKKESMIRFDSVCCRIMADKFIFLYPEHELADTETKEHFFYDWARNTNKNRVEKAEAYCEAYFQTYGKEISPDHHRVTEFINTRQHQLIKQNNSELNDWWQD